MNDENVMLEYRIESRNGEPYRAQILDNGTYRIWSGTNYKIKPDGTSSMQKQEAKWRPYTSLNPERLGRLKDTIKRSNFFGLNPVYAPENDVKDGRTTVWFASLDGKQHEVRITGTPTIAVPQLDQLKQAMDTIAQEALDERL
jgi:hypothetical protein